eukprot:1743070-Rhodomonas_salina.1
MVLCACYEMRGTDIANGVRRYARAIRIPRLKSSVAYFPTARRVLHQVRCKLGSRSPISLRARYAMPGAVSAYHAMRNRHSKTCGWGTAVGVACTC